MLNLSKLKLYEQEKSYKLTKLQHKYYRCLFSKNKSLQYKFAYLITKTIKILKVHKILSKNILNSVFRVYIHHDGNRIVKNV